MARSVKPSRELREHAVALVLERQHEHSSQWHAIRAVATEVGVPTESLWRWLREAETEAGVHSGRMGTESARIRELERENRELHRTIEALRSSSVST